jgi:hypothetical protein
MPIIFHYSAAIPGGGRTPIQILRTPVPQAIPNQNIFGFWSCFHQFRVHPESTTAWPLIPLRDHFRGHRRVRKQKFIEGPRPTIFAFSTGSTSILRFEKSTILMRTEVASLNERGNSAQYFPLIVPRRIMPVDKNVFVCKASLIVVDDKSKIRDGFVAIIRITGIVALKPY